MRPVERGHQTKNTRPDGDKFQLRGVFAGKHRLPCAQSRHEPQPVSGCTRQAGFSGGRSAAAARKCASGIATITHSKAITLPARRTAPKTQGCLIPDVLPRLDVVKEDGQPLKDETHQTKSHLARQINAHVRALLFAGIEPEHIVINIDLRCIAVYQQSIIHLRAL